jgi:ABC-type transporter Mla MlaB component
MAITNTWSVSDMQHMDSDGGVFLVYWSMVAQAMVRHPTLLLKAASSVVSMTLQALPSFRMLI